MLVHGSHLKAHPRRPAAVGLTLLAVDTLLYQAKASSGGAFWHSCAFLQQLCLKPDVCGRSDDVVHAAQALGDLGSVLNTF